jgi:hypothetical protein
MFDVPVALFIFNRPDLTFRVFEEVAKQRPKKLLLIADGPRNEAEREACEKTRSVAERIDWDCEVLTNFSNENLNCKQRFTTGFRWIFENCETAIIFEDDCLPHPTFFPYCEELLDRYKDDERVMTISGDNFQFGTRRSEYSYYFSRYSHTWGWASWRRAWKLFDPEASAWPELRKGNRLLELLGDEEVAAYWLRTFDSQFAGTADDVWDFQWAISCWAQSALTILPEVNLISNIGWRSDATHTKDELSAVGNLQTYPMEFPIKHPPVMVRDRDADRYTFERLFLSYDGMDRSLYRRIRRKLSNIRHEARKNTRGAVAES